MAFEEGKSGNPATQFRSGTIAEEAGRKGGAASGESKRRVKSLKEALRILLEMQHKDGRTGYENVAVGLYNKALKGDVQASKFLAEMMAEYRQRIELGNDGKAFEIKTIKVKEGMEKKINDYLNGSGLDGQGVQ